MVFGVRSRSIFVFVVSIAFAFFSLGSGLETRGNVYYVSSQPDGCFNSFFVASSPWSSSRLASFHFSSSQSAIVLRKNGKSANAAQPDACSIDFFVASSPSLSSRLASSRFSSSQSAIVLRKNGKSANANLFVAPGRHRSKKLIVYSSRSAPSLSVSSFSSSLFAHSSLPRSDGMFSCMRRVPPC